MGFWGKWAQTLVKWSMSIDETTTKTYFNPNEIEEVSESLASDTGARTGAIWVNPSTHQALQSESEYAHSKLRHYFTDRDAAIASWGVFENDPKVISKVGVILRKVEAHYGSKIQEYFHLDSKAYLAVVLANGNHAAAAWIHKGQINTRDEIKGSFMTENLGKTFFVTTLPAVSKPRVVMKETEAPAHRTCLTCGSPVPPSRSCEWCPE